jgi:hypothetical protein
MRKYSKNTKFYENPITGETGQSKYSILHSTACRDARITPAQYKMLGYAINLPHGLAAFAVKGNVLKHMIAAGLVEIVNQSWGLSGDNTDVVIATDKGRAAYRTLTEAA